MHEFEEKASESREISKLLQEVNEFVEWIFFHYRKKRVRDGKVIHDCVWGTNRFEAFEVALLDTPLVQRLRQIHQTSTSYLTYPSTQHTRFEHTLGVTAQVNNLTQALLRKFRTSQSEKKEGFLGEPLFRTLRVASILHDCGHGCYSHSSEELFQEYGEIKEIRKWAPFKSAAPHEIFSYLILNSKIFYEKVFANVLEDYNVDIDYELMKNCIVGHPSDPEQSWKVDILHGPVDVDKIDYLFRDGHASGLPLQFDLDRFWYTLDINKAEGHRRLTIDYGGITCMEQMMFSKMLLFPCVYHHHKVRAADCMFKGMVEYIRTNPKTALIKRTAFGDKTLDFSRAIHFLYFTDADLYNVNLTEGDQNLHELIHNLIYRRLLKRAVVISRDTLDDKNKEDKMDLFHKYIQEPRMDGVDFYRLLAEKIWEKAGKPCLSQEVWVDCPDVPNFDEVSDTWISPLSKEVEPQRLTDFFAADKYANQYKYRKWKGHVFCPPEHVEKIAVASVKVFKEEMDIGFNPLAFQLCHSEMPQTI